MGNKRTVKYTLTNKSNPNESLSVTLHVIEPFIDFYIKKDGERVDGVAKYEIGDVINLVIETERIENKNFKIDLSQQGAIFKDRGDEFEHTITSDIEEIELEVKELKKVDEHKNLEDIITVIDSRGIQKKCKAKAWRAGLMGADIISANISVEIINSIFEKYPGLNVFFQLNNNKFKSIDLEKFLVTLDEYSKDNNYETLKALAIGFVSTINNADYSIWLSIRKPGETWVDKTLIEEAGLGSDMKNGVWDWMYTEKLLKDQAGTYGINENNALVVLDQTINIELLYKKIGESGSSFKQKTNIYDMFIHEVLGEAVGACGYDKNCLGGDSGQFGIYPIQVENLNRKLRGENTFRTGEDHWGGEVDEPLSIPSYLKK